MKVLIIIPAYNEQDSIRAVIEELKAAEPDYDYVVINDCSSDRTLEVIEQEGFNRLDLPDNLGVGGGVQTGYLYALRYGYDIAVQMDGDGQHDPSYLKKIVDPVMSGEADVCIGSRFIDKAGFQTSFMRRFGIRVLSFIIRLCCSHRCSDATSGFRACNKAVFSHFAEHYAQDHPEPEAVVSAVLAGFKVKEVPVVMRERTAGVSSISPAKSVYFMLKVSLAILLCRFLTPPVKRRRML